MATSLRKLLIDFTPGIRRKLLDRQAHLPVLFIQRYDLCFVYITQFEEFFCVHWRIGPGNLANVYKSFNTRLYFKECAIIFNIHYFTFYDLPFLDSIWQHFPRM